ncbi:MAG: AAA family ATPase [Pygmaiobacter massiliensis]|nr:AAA family ATPase [Pygmaiobacter massiliensis]
MEGICSLIGAQAVKKLAQELCAVAPRLNRTHTEAVFAKRAYLICADDGCGVTRCLESVADLIDELKLFPFTSGAKVEEMSPETPLEEMLGNADGRNVARQLLCFDIRQWMDKCTEPTFRSFLRALHKYSGQQLLAFRIPYVDEATRNKVSRALSDVFTVRELSLPPFSEQELCEKAQQLLQQSGFSLTDSGWEVFRKRIIEEKSDNRFYGMDTVDKVVCEMFYEKQLALANGTGDTEQDTTITAEDLSGLGSADKIELTAMQQLEALQGLGSVKEKLLEIVSQIKLAQTDTAIGAPTLHMRFIGNPGTGKTTVARILGRLLKEEGVLSKGNFYEFSGRDFCGEYIGQTAPKTSAMCRDAYGSVLFIDEAYSLYRGDADNRDFGREAIDTLVAQMENHRSDLLVIMAGYEKDLDTLMEANAGLKSRMPYLIEFSNYSRDELCDIYFSMLEGKFDYEAALKTAVCDYFDTLSDELLKAEDFANARFVRNLFERTWAKAALRHRLEPDQPLIILACDFDKAAAEREFQELQQKQTRKIGF